MDAQVTQVAVRADDRPLTWPKEADIICLFATVEGYFSYRNPVDGSWLVLNLCHQINQWLKNYKENKTDLEFHHLLIKVGCDKFLGKNFSGFNTSNTRIWLVLRVKYGGHCVE